MLYKLSHTVYMLGLMARSPLVGDVAMKTSSKLIKVVLIYEYVCII